jgi:lactate racemase
MADTYTAVIPYESLDPLTIGSSGDEEKVSRDTLELEIPESRLLAAVYPDEPDPGSDPTRPRATRSSRRSRGRGSPSSWRPPRGSR